MENTNEDKFAKEILLNSRLQITNPDFKHVIMDKIRAESRKKVIFHNIKLYLLTFVGFDAVLFALLKLMHVEIHDISNKIVNFNWDVGELLSNPWQFMFVYFIVLLALILITSAIFNGGFSYTKMRIEK